MSKRVTMIWVLTCLLAVTGCAQESLPFVEVPGGTFTRGVEGGTGFPNYDTLRFIVDPGNRTGERQRGYKPRESHAALGGGV
jgi:hypothetical protein